MTRFGLLFDLDGTLVDTDAAHLAAFADVLQPAGVAVDEAFYRSRIAGRSNAQILAETVPDASQADLLRLSAEKERLYRNRLGEVRLLPGAGALLRWARAESITCALVTTSPRASVEAVLAATGIAEGFDRLVVGDELARGKPDPLPYLTALEVFGLGSNQALAFEDSLTGLASAVGAGVPTIALLTTLDLAAARRAGAIGAIPDFLDGALRDLITARRRACEREGRTKLPG